MGTYPAVDPSMVLYYHFNNQSAFGENDTHIYDFSGNQNNATALNASLLQLNSSFLNDGSYYFNGTSGFIQGRQINYSGADYTYSIWVKRDGDGGVTEKLIGQGDASSRAGLSIVRSTRRLRLDLNNGSAQSFLGNTALNNGQWYYVVLTVEGNNIKFYLDGQPDGTGTGINLKNQNFTIYLGSRLGLDTFLNGSLDEAIIYNRTLSQREIWDNYIIYRDCINLTQGINIYGSTDFCSQDISLNSSSTGTVDILANDSYINFTGAHYFGNGSNTFLYITNLNNITLEGLNVTNYPFSIYGENPKNILIKSFFINTVYNGFLSILNPTNLTITDSSFGLATNSPTITGINIFNGGTNVNITNNLFKQCTAYGCIRIINATNGNNINIENNKFNGNSSILNLIVNSKGIFIKNNLFNNSNNNFDSYNIGINILGNLRSQGLLRFSFTSKDIIIQNNTFNNIGCSAILAQGINNISILNNSFNYNKTISINNSANCGYEPVTAIDLVARWKTWTSDGFENYTDDINILGNYTFANINISGNTFINYPNLLRVQKPTNLSHDLSNYWAKSMQINNYYDPITHYYISNNFENLFTLFNETNNNPVIERDLLGSRYAGFSTTIPFVSFKIYKNYSYFENTNQSYAQGCGSNCSAIQPFGVNLFNQTNSLIYFSNGSVACSNIATCDNNINITLTPLNYSYVLDNFNLTEGVTRQFSPLSVSGSSTSKTITSQLSQAINATVVVNAPSCPISGTYDGTSISSSSCNGNQATFLLEDIPAGVSVLSLSQVTTITDSLIDQLALTPALIGLILLALFFGIAIKALLDFRNMGKIDWKQLLIQVIIVGFIGIVLLLFSVVYQTLGNIGG